MTSQNKLSKISRRHHWGRGRCFLKSTTKLKRVAMYNSKMRKQIKNEKGEQLYGHNKTSIVNRADAALE